MDSYLATAMRCCRARDKAFPGPVGKALAHVHYALIAVAALVARLTQQTEDLLIATLVTMAIGVVYWAVVIFPKRGKAWQILGPAGNGE